MLKGMAFTPCVGAKCVPVRVSRKGVPIVGAVLVCDLWTLGIEDRVSVHRTDCHASSCSPLDKVCFWHTALLGC